MPTLVQACSTATCKTWDELFCICNATDEAASVCAPAVTDFTNDPEGDYLVCYPGYDPGIVDRTPDLIGQYSTTATTSSTMPTTGGDTLAAWSNTDNARQEADGAYASISPSPLVKPLGQQFIACTRGTEYIVLTGYGLLVPPNSTIHGISVGAKGYGIRNLASSAAAIRVWNVALMLNGTPYYRCDPRSNSDKQQVSHTLFPCGPGAASPYPVDCAPHGQVPYYAQPMGNLSPGGFIQSGKTDSRTANIPANIMPSIVSLEWFAGNAGACVNAVYDNTVKSSVTQKDMFIPTLKQVWTRDEVNDPSFGVALSIFGTNTNLLGTPSGLTTLTLNLDCIGVAVYYTTGVEPPRTRQPNTFIVS